MIELGLTREVPERRAASYTDAVVSAILSAASVSSTGSAVATAAVEMAASRWARALASASASHPSVTPALLADVGRQLCRRGEAIYDLAVDAGGVRFVPATACDIQGGPDPASWRYRLNIPAPSGMYQVTRERAGLAHFVYARDPARPWVGLGPLQWAATSGALLGHVEGALRDEASGPTGTVIPLPEGAEASTAFKGEFEGLRGRIAFPETLARGSGDMGGAPNRDYRPERLGAAPGAALVSLRQHVEVSVLSACGVPPALCVGLNDGTLLRESYRQFLFLTVRPLGRLIAATLSEVLGELVTLTFDELGAADVQARSRAWRALVGKQATMDTAQADRIVGFTSDGV